MENSLAHHTTQTSRNSSREGTPLSDEIPHDNNQRTPVETVIDFEGNVTRVRTHKLRTSKVSKPCLSFCLHSCALAIALVVSLVMMIVRGVMSEEGKFWVAMFMFAVGGFIPSPSYKVNYVEKVGHAASQPQQTSPQFKN